MYVSENNKKGSSPIELLVWGPYRRRLVQFQGGRLILKVFYAREPRGSSAMWSRGAVVLKSASRPAGVSLTARTHSPDGVRTRCLFPGEELGRRRQSRCIRGHHATTGMRTVSTHDPARFRTADGGRGSRGRGGGCGTRQARTRIGSVSKTGVRWRKMGEIKHQNEAEMTGEGPRARDEGRPAGRQIAADLQPGGMME